MKILLTATQSVLATRERSKGEQTIWSESFKLKHTFTLFPVAKTTEA